MIRLTNESVIWKNNAPVPCAGPQDGDKHATMSYAILDKHNTSSDPSLYRIRFDALTSHDITYVGIIQTARASGLEKFPMPYAMTNCHNSLCAVGGTINEDDHVFGLSAAIKYGGVFVPPNTAVIHQYAREKLARCGAMVLGSDSHTRYGALGTMGVGEGGPELVKQLLENTYDVPAPQVVLVYLTGKPKHGVGPHDVAIALCQAVFANGFVKNKVMEFAGPGIASLGMDFRIGIDVMTTETTCLSSIWETDEKVQEFYMNHGRPQDYAPMHPQEGARYDSMIEIDLSTIDAMIALPFHPSNAVTIHELLENPMDILHSVEVEAAKKFGAKASLHLTDKVRDGKIYVDQGVIAGCAGGMYDNICAAEAILSQKSTGNGYFSLSVYPSSLPINMALIKNGVQAGLMEAGAIFKPCFCGPCFGAGDVPANNGLSIRHTTRNFPNREGSKPGEGQLAAVALMDARSIAATAANGGVLTAATDVEYTENFPAYTYDDTMYQKRIYQGFGDAKSESELKFGPNITDWPKMQPLSENILLKLDAVIHDPVTTTDELIPSGETSSYRSNPLRLAEFALSRRVPSYVADAKATNKVELARQAVVAGQDGDVSSMIQALKSIFPGKADADYAAMLQHTSMGSCVFANRPGDGSAREQAASCQKVLGGAANICYEYATKRYRSNCINWGMLPFTLDAETPFEYETGDYIYVPGVREAVEKGITVLEGTVLSKNGTSSIKLNLAGLTADEKQILLDGCLINYYAAHH